MFRAVEVVLIQVHPLLSGKQFLVRQEEDLFPAFRSALEDGILQPGCDIARGAIGRRRLGDGYGFRAADTGVQFVDRRGGAVSMQGGEVHNRAALGDCIVSVPIRIVNTANGSLSIPKQCSAFTDQFRAFVYITLTFQGPAHADEARFTVTGA